MHPWRTHAGVDSWQNCDLWIGAYRGTGFLVEHVALWEPTLEQPVPNGLYPMEMLHAGAVLEELKPVESTLIGEVCKRLGVMEGTCSGMKEKCEGGRSSRHEVLDSTQPLCPSHLSCLDRKRQKN